VTTAKNGLLFRLQRRLLLAGKAANPSPPPSSCPKSWLVRSRPASRGFHSLEDRIVKTFIARESKEVVDRNSPSLYSAPQAMKLVALGRLKPDVGEVRANPRARSATLRVAERTEVVA